MTAADHRKHLEAGRPREPVGTHVAEGRGPLEPPTPTRSIAPWMHRHRAVPATGWTDCWRRADGVSCYGRSLSARILAAQQSAARARADADAAKQDAARARADADTAKQDAAQARGVCCILGPDAGGPARLRRLGGWVDL